MDIFPAIDILEGKVVRLSQGNYDKKTIYSEDPKTFAKQWEDQGAEWLHIVDLGGAKHGHLKNHEKLLEIRHHVNCKIQFGGGLRNINDIGTVINAGIDRVIIGTKALDESFLQTALNQFGAKIVVGLDIREGKVQTEGWLQCEGRRLEDVVHQLCDHNVQTIAFTDILKDGMMSGPNFDKLEELLKMCTAQVILSGGVSSIKDVVRCTKITSKRFEGVIIGRALYEEEFTVEDAVKIAKGQ